MSGIRKRALRYGRATGVARLRADRTRLGAMLPPMAGAWRGRGDRRRGGRRRRCGPVAGSIPRWTQVGPATGDRQPRPGRGPDGLRSRGRIVGRARSVGVGRPFAGAASAGTARSIRVRSVLGRAVPNRPVLDGPVLNRPIPSGSVPNGPVPNGLAPNGPTPNDPQPNDPKPNGSIPGRPTLRSTPARTSRSPAPPHSFWLAIQRSILRSRISSGTEPSLSISAWKARTSKRSPRACSARLRNCWIFSSPIL